MNKCGFNAQSFDNEKRDDEKGYTYYVLQNIKHFLFLDILH